MCKVGDIIVIKEYRSHGTPLSRHSFVIISLENGQICGADFDLVCTMMSSFHSEEHRKKKLSYPGNLEYSAEQEHVKNGHGKPGFIKADQLYYFVQSDLDYYRIGYIDEELLDELVQRINEAPSIDHIIDNLN